MHKLQVVHLLNIHIFDFHKYFQVLFSTKHYCIVINSFDLVSFAFAFLFAFQLIVYLSLKIHLIPFHEYLLVNRKNLIKIYILF